jgi:hypothetical protein
VTKWMTNSALRALGLPGEYAVHDLCALQQHRTYLLAVDTLGNFGPACVADQASNVLDGYSRIAVTEPELKPVPNGVGDRERGRRRACATDVASQPNCRLKGWANVSATGLRTREIPNRPVTLRSAYANQEARDCPLALLASSTREAARVRGGEPRPRQGPGVPGGSLPSLIPGLDIHRPQRSGDCDSVLGLPDWRQHPDGVVRGISV